MSDLKIKRLFVSFWNPKTKQRDRLWFPDEARRQAFLADLRADYPLSSLAPQIWDDEIDEQQTGLPNNPGPSPEGSKGTGSRDGLHQPFPPLTARVCDKCYWQEDDEEHFIAEFCDGSDDGAHHLVDREHWVAILADDLYGIGSDEEAMESFAELSYTRSAYHAARRLTVDELRALNEGRAKLVITVQSLVSQQASDPDAQGGQ